MKFDVLAKWDVVLFGVVAFLCLDSWTTCDTTLFALFENTGLTEMNDAPRWE